MSESESSSANELQRFELADGKVAGDGTQEETENFAADLQGLRHFGRRIGAALDLGEPWHGGFREDDFTHLWAATTEGTSDTDPANGAMIGRKVPYYELIETLTQGDD
jgi:hypothetical protein